jgi:hypothetical protein
MEAANGRLRGTAEVPVAGTDYNYEHFRTRHLVLDAEGTLRTHGIEPGEEAPDWEMALAGGGHLRLSDLRGHPVLLHFGSGT